MTPQRQVLQNHTLVVRDGRILDIAPSAAARQRYESTALVQRPAHLLMPGMINAQTHAAMSLDPERSSGPEDARDGCLAGIAEMLQSGITCFGDRSRVPGETARSAAEQGMRAVVGLAVADGPSPSLKVRDDYRGHPLISTAFAPRAPNAVSDETFARIAALADELDAGIIVDLHRSAAEIDESMVRYGRRPIERLWHAGLLTPATNAVHMVHLSGADIDLAQRTGIAVSLCPQADLKQGAGAAPAVALVASGMRVGIGSGGAERQNQDVWGEMKLLALLSRIGPAPLGAWDALTLATRGGAAALGLDAEVGTLEIGKWADLCCVDLGGPAMHPVNDPVEQLVFCGGREMVSDVWVAGRQLLSEGEMTRLDWPGVAARANARAERLKTGG